MLLSLPHGDGGIFGVFSITSRNAEDRERFIHILRSHLEVMRSDIVNDDLNIPRRFEAMLVQLNADLARFSESHRLPLKHINVLLGVMTNTQVFFSGIGSHHALFLHQTAERRYVVYELDAQLANQESSWEKPLITVLDGELHPGDVFYVATRIPSHALNIGDLQDILVTLPPNGALERIQQFVPVTHHFGGVCFHVNDDAPTGPPKKANPMASLSSFEETQARTADLLGDQSPNMSLKLAHGLSSAKKALVAYSESALWRAVKRGARGLITLLEGLLRRNNPDRDASTRRSFGSHGRFNGIATKLTTLRHAGITAARGASRTTKVVGIGAVIVVVILVISINMGRAQQRIVTANATYETQITKIEEKRSAAEAAIIYGNTQDAQMLLADAQALIATLSRETTAQKTKAEDFSRAVSELLGKTRGLETVISSTIAELPDQFAFPLVGLFSAETAMYSVSADAAPWRVNEVSKALERVDIGTSPAQNVMIIASEGTDALVVDMDQRLWRSTTGTPNVTSLTSGTDGMASVEDIVSYNNNVYALSASSGQIVKMRPQGLGFEAGTPWISGKTSDLSQAKALTVDGDVWVLTSTDVVVFASGKEKPWNHAAIDPVLVKPLDIWTGVDSPYLYILDGADGRVIVMEKQSGSIVAQYISNISSVVGFTVRENENRIILATPTTVYSYTASHLLK
jgi:hypothetical protein